jgi:hypothetical protein
LRDLISPMGIEVWGSFPAGLEQERSRLGGNRSVNVRVLDTKKRPLTARRIRIDFKAGRDSISVRVSGRPPSGESRSAATLPQLEHELSLAGELAAAWAGAPLNTLRSELFDLLEVRSLSALRATLISADSSQRCQTDGCIVNAAGAVDEDRSRRHGGSTACAPARRLIIARVEKPFDTSADGERIKISPTVSAHCNLTSSQLGTAGPSVHPKIVATKKLAASERWR